jgi:hypothetical protein
MMAAAPAMIDLLSELIAGVDRDILRGPTKRIMREIASHRPRKTDED